MTDIPENQSGSENSFDSDLDFEIDKGIPQVEDQFIQIYLNGRDALIEQEQKQRHGIPNRLPNLSMAYITDALLKSTLSPIAKQAAKTIRSIRHRELDTTWSGPDVFPNMMFPLARERITTHSTMWRIIERMPKGALLHAHLDAMFDVNWLVDELLNEPGLCILSDVPLADELSCEEGALSIRFHDSAGDGNIWNTDYTPMTPVSVRQAAKSFPGGTEEFKRWLIFRCTISKEQSLDHHHGLDAIWKKFQACFATIGWILFYEPIFRRGMQRLLGQLADDGITYVDFRVAFKFEFRLAGQERGDVGKYMDFFRVFDEEIERFKKTDKGKAFHGARMIWTVIRALSNREMVPSMEECIRIKKAMPHVIAGFDFVGQEDKGRSLSDLIPIIFWFRKQCVEAEVDIPFFFHAGECFGDGDATDKNLFDAILLGTRRIGHGYSLYKHPLLIDMVKERKILVECCPISNEVLRLTSSTRAHSLPALLARGVAVALGNDDPAILGHAHNGLSHDYWQAIMAWENLGLEGLANMCENSIRWSAIEDQKQSEWLKEINEGYLGVGAKAERLKAWRSEFEKFCQWVILEFPLEDEDGDEDE